MTVLAFPTPDPGPEEEAAPVSTEAGRVSAARARLERVAPLPTAARARSSAWWWCTTGLRKLAVLAVRAPWLVLCELRPIGVGFGRIVYGWARWCACDDYAARLSEAEQHAEKFADRLEARREGRRRWSMVLVVLLGGLVWAAAARWPEWLLLAAGLAVVAADAVGRHVAPRPSSLPAPARAVLTEGVPLTQITRAVVDRAMDRWGIELGVARAMTYSPERREYEVHVTSAEALTVEHMRDFERAIGATDHAMRCLAPADGNALVRRLIIREGDPLAVPAPAPELAPRSGSITEWAGLGVSMTDTPFALPFAGVHYRVVAGTGGGKTSWFLRGAIRALSAKYDVVLGGIDITNGPELTLWRGVIQHKGLTVEDAEKVLDTALSEIERRSRILAEIAEDDDPDNDCAEWHTGLGPAFVVFVDEFAQLAVYDGKGGRPNLLGKAEQVVRTGRKHWVSLVMATQKTGNDDFGSTTMSSQCGVTIAGPCEPADTVRMFGVELRDRGFTPHMLAPGVEGDIRDAGKVFISSPAHRTPDVYRLYAPGSTAEVKRLARQRMEAGLPTLAGPEPAEAVEAVEVPPLLAAVDRVFVDAGDPEWMATVDLLPLVRAAGFPQLTEAELADGLPIARDVPGSRKRRPGERNPSRGYLLASVRLALEEL